MGQVLEGTGLKDRVDVCVQHIDHGGFGVDLPAPVTDRFSGFHDTVGGAVGGLHDGFQFQATVAGCVAGQGDDAGDLFTDRVELTGKIGL